MRGSIAIFLCLVAVGCTSNEEEFDTGFLDDTGDTDDTGELEECEVNVVAFDYGDQAAWVNGNPDCGGSSQSPIDLQPETNFFEGETPVLAFAYTTSALHVINNGHSIEYEIDDASNTLTVDGTDYALLQFHFHSPSEHTVDGQNAAMEMHLVHKSQSDALAVVSILIFPGEAEQPWIASASWDEIPAQAGECLEDEETVLDMDDLINGQLGGGTKDVVHYNGSLTTPPCSEDVEWFILGEYMLLSSEQIATFSDIYSGNNREVQALNDRTIFYDESYGN